MPSTVKLPRIASTPTARTALADPARLRALPFLAGLDLAALTELSPNIDEQRFQAGDYILRAGQYCDGAYFISAGVVEARVAPADPAASASDPRAVARLRSQEYRLPASLSSATRDDLTVVLAGVSVSPQDTGRTTLETGDIFGEISALSRYAVASDVVAVSDTTCWLIGTPALRRIFDNPALSAFKEFFDRRYRERTLASVISRTTLFDLLSEAELDRLRATADLVSYKPNRVIAKQGDPVDGLLLVRGGYVKVSARTGREDIAVTYLRKGDHAGEASILLGQPWPYTLTALEHVELIRLPKAEVQSVLADHPGIAERLWRTATNTLKTRGAVMTDPLSAGYTQFAMDSGLIHGESVLLIDLSTCTRCDECVRGCADAHGGTPRFVREGAKFRAYSIPSACYQCTDPVCMIGCPTGAISRPLGTLEVTIDETTCIGCGNCSRRCPWENIRTVPFDSPALGREIPLATKCDLCVGRPEGPACVQMCPHGAAVRVNFKEFERTRERLLREVAS